MKCKFTIEGDVVLIETNHPRYKILRYTLEVIIKDLKSEYKYGAFYIKILNQFAKEYPEALL